MSAQRQQLCKAMKYTRLTSQAGNSGDREDARAARWCMLERHMHTQARAGRVANNNAALECTRMTIQDCKRTLQARKPSMDGDWESVQTAR